MLLELKWDKDASTAIQQIKQKEYPKAFEGYGGEILLVGISYDRKTREHRCSIERYPCDMACRAPENADED